MDPFKSFKDEVPCKRHCLLVWVVDYCDKVKWVDCRDLGERYKDRWGWNWENNDGPFKTTEYMQEIGALWMYLPYPYDDGEKDSLEGCSCEEKYV